LSLDLRCARQTGRVFHPTELVDLKGKIRHEAGARDFHWQASTSAARCNFGQKLRLCWQPTKTSSGLFKTHATPKDCSPQLPVDNAVDSRRVRLRVPAIFFCLQRGAGLRTVGDSFSICANNIFLLPGNGNNRLTSHRPGHNLGGSQRLVVRVAASAGPQFRICAQAPRNI
jgi:hypothetical protein